jgi:amino acid transporter
MTTPNIPPVDAELALAEVRARRAQVVDTNLVPDWFWYGIAVLMMLFVAAMESEIGWLIAVGTIVYTLGLATLILALVRRARVQVRQELIGVRGALAIAGFTVTLVAIGVALGFTLDALGVPLPATLGCLPVAIGLAVGGPRLMSHLRRLMLSRPVAGPR